MYFPMYSSSCKIHLVFHKFDMKLRVSLNLWNTKFNLQLDEYTKCTLEITYIP